MTRSLSLNTVVALFLLVGSSGASADPPRGEPVEAGTLPTDAGGRPLNLDFETGTLADWTAEGDAFRGQPIEGDTVHRRRGDMHSRHAGRFWVGTYERGGDSPKGRLTSVPFRVTKPFASFLVGAGSHARTCVELVRKDTGKVVFRASGDDTEDMERVVVDLTDHLGREIVIRLVDGETVGWGHVNFDDFRLHDTKPAVPPRRRPAALDVYQHAGLAPEEAARAMTVPPGFTVTLFAGEPDVVQPIAMAIDDRGRLWVAEAYSYPRRVPDARGQGPHPHLRRHRRRRPVQHPQGLRRSPQPRQRTGSRIRRRLGRRGPASPVHPRPRRRRPPRRTARRSCSTAGGSTIPTRRSIPSPGARTAGSTAATAFSPIPASASPAPRRMVARRSTRESGGITRPGTSSRSSPTAPATPGASISTPAAR